MLVPTAKKKNIGPPYKINQLIVSGDINNIYCKYLRNHAHSVQEYIIIFLFFFFKTRWLYRCSVTKKTVEITPHGQIS